MAPGPSSSSFSSSEVSEASEGGFRGGSSSAASTVPDHSSAADKRIKPYVRMEVCNASGLSAFIK